MPHNVILLAGDTRSRLGEALGLKLKDLVPIHHKALLEWTIEAFARCPAVENLVVVGPDELEDLAAMRHVRKRVFGGLNHLQSLLHAITYVKTTLYHNANRHSGYVVAFGDLPLLTPEKVTRAFEQIAESDADVIGWYIEQEQLLRAGYTLRKDGVEIGGKPVFAAGLYYLRRMSQLATAIEALQQLQDQLENPQHALQRLGCAGKTLAVAESILSERFGAKVALLPAKDPEWAMKIDSAEALAAASERLQSPWKHDYQKVKLIANPNAGKGLLLSPLLRQLLGLPARGPGSKQADFSEAIKTIQQDLADFGITAEAEVTQAPGDARRLTEACVESGYDLVIAAGGDGTINEIANVLAGTDVTLGVIPFGTANVLGVQLRLPMLPRAACQVIAEGNAQRIDLGRVEGRYFVSMAGIGFDAHIVKTADSKMKAVLGALSYLFVGVTHALTYRFRRIVLQIDGEPKRRWGYLVIIGNGKYYAGDMIVASKADLTDGKLDVCIFKHRNVFALIGYLFGMRRGDIDRFLNVEYVQCERVSIMRRGRHGVHVDAEYLGETPVEIEVMPKALRVVV